MPPRACQAAKHGVDLSTAYPDWKVEKLRDAVVSFLNQKFGAVVSSAGANADIGVPSAGMRTDDMAAGASTCAAGTGPVPGGIETHEACAVAPEWISFGALARIVPDRFSIPLNAFSMIPPLPFMEFAIEFSKPCMLLISSGTP